MRRKHYGSNQLRTHPKQSVFVILAHQFRGMISWLLAFAAGLSFYFDDIVEGVAIVFVLVINALIATVTTRVRSGGKVRRIEAQDLVPGDIVLLNAGDMVAAD